MILELPRMSQTEFETRMEAIVDGSREVFLTLESSLKHLVSIGAISEAEAARIREREIANGGLVDQQKKENYKKFLTKGVA
jgi:acetolactate synthase small subunit